jgi:hypothetical protein
MDGAAAFELGLNLHGAEKKVRSGPKHGLAARAFFGARKGRGEIVSGREREESERRYCEGGGPNGRSHGRPCQVLHDSARFTPGFAGRRKGTQA